MNINTVFLDEFILSDFLLFSDYNNEDVFVHSSAIIKNNPNKYKPSLNEGEPVEFDILKSKIKILK